MTTTQLPVLFLTDHVVLPGMVVPIELDEVARTAVDTARTSSSDELLIAPRLGGPLRRVRRSGDHRPGRPAGRRRARGGAARRATGPDRLRCGRTGQRAVGRGPRDRGPGGRRRGGPRARGRVQEPGHRHPAAPRRLADHRHRQQDQRPVPAGRPGRLRAIPGRREEAPPAGDAERPRAADHADRLDQGSHRRDRGQRQDRRRRTRGDGEEPARVPAPSAAQRHPQGARRGRAGRRAGLPHQGRGGRAARGRPQGRPPRGRRNWSGRATRAPSPATSGPGSTSSWSCPGAPRPSTRPTSPRRARCWTRTTTAWRTSRTGSSSIWRSAAGAPLAGWRSSAVAVPVPCWPWSVRPASARPRSASRSPARSAGSSSGWRSAASGTRRRSAATGGRTSVRCPAGSSGPSPRPDR